MFSPQYYVALAEAKEHHATSKTYSGKFLRPHAPVIKRLIEELEIKTILDYGCGKGVQYSWVSDGGSASIPEGMTLEQYWGIEVTKYDPAWPPYAQEPQGPFDLVLCTHTLGSIPTTDLFTVVGRLADLATKAVYIAEKLGPVHKQVFESPDLMPRWPRDAWVRFLSVFARGRPDLRWMLSLRHPRDERDEVKTEWLTLPADGLKRCTCVHYPAQLPGDYAHTVRDARCPVHG